MENNMENDRFSLLDLSDDDQILEIQAPGQITIEIAPAPVVDIRPFRPMPTLAPEPVVAKTVVTAKSLTDGLVAVADETEATGAVTYWRLEGTVNHAALCDALTAAGLNLTFFPPKLSAEAALARGMETFKGNGSVFAGRKTLVQKHKKSNSWAIGTMAEKETDEGFGFTNACRIFLDEEGKIQGRQLEDPTFTYTKLNETVEAAEVAYVVALTHLNTVDISAWLVSLATKLSGVALRDRGGIYFIPKTHTETLKKIQTVLKAISNNILYTIPAMKSAESIQAILDAVTSEISDEITAIESELNDETGRRVIKNRIDEVSAMVKKVAGYEELLGLKMPAVAAKLSAITEKLGKAAIASTSSTFPGSSGPCARGPGAIRGNFS